LLCGVDSDLQRSMVANASSRGTFRSSACITVRCLGIEVDDALSISKQMGRSMIEAYHAVGPYRPMRSPTMIEKPAVEQ
jgi:hypothetical protein